MTRLRPDQEQLWRELAEFRARIGAAPAPDLASRVEALETEIGDVKDTLAAAYNEAGLSEQPGRPALRVIEGGAA